VIEGATFYGYLQGKLMPNHPSAEKRVRQSQRRRERNRRVASAVKTAVKKVHEALSAKNIDLMQSTLRLATSSLDGAASKGIIPKKRAARKVSRLSKQISRFSKSPST